MRKISLWAVGIMMTSAFASIVSLGQTPAPTERPTVEGTQSSQGSVTERQEGRRKHGQDRLARIDANRDGRISREEWPRNPEGFSRLDANNDGFLTTDEMRQAREKGGRAHRSFQTMDQNSDGQITREEWKGRAEVFDRLDSNHDGTVKTDELKGRGGKRHPR